MHAFRYKAVKILIIRGLPVKYLESIRKAARHSGGLFSYFLSLF